MYQFPLAVFFFCLDNAASGELSTKKIGEITCEDNSSDGLCIRIRNAWWSWLVVVVYHAKISLEVGRPSHTF